MRNSTIAAYILTIAVVAVALVAAPRPPAIAQQPQPAPPPDYSITLNGQEWFFIGEAIAERPFKQANPILQKINQQITAIATQRQKEEAEAAAKAKADAEKPKEPQGNPALGAGPQNPAAAKPE